MAYYKPGDKIDMITILECLGQKKTSGGYSTYVYKAQCDCGEIIEINEGRIKDYDIYHRRSHVGCHKCSNKDRKGKQYKNRYDNNNKAVGIYNTMKQRCYNPNNKKYKNYGARGITICDEWLGDQGLNNFCDWMYKEAGFTDNSENCQYSINRYDNDKGYSPDNCYITGFVEQSNNKTQSSYVWWYGTEYTCKELDSIYKLTPEHVRRGLSDGQSLNDLLLDQDLTYGEKMERKRKSPVNQITSPKPFIQYPFKFVDHSEINTNDPNRLLYNNQRPKPEHALDVIATQRRLRARDLGHPVAPFQFTDGKSDDFLCSYVDPLIPYRYSFENNDLH